MIEVEMGGSDPLVARKMLDKYLNTYIRMENEKRDKLGKKMRLWLNTEMEESKRRLKEAQEELFDFTKKHEIVLKDSTPNPKLGDLSEAARFYFESKARRVKLEKMHMQKEKVLPTDLDDESVKALRKNLADLRSQLSELEGIYSPGYPKVVILRNRIEHNEKTLAALEQKSLARALETAKKSEARAKDDLDKAKHDAIAKNSLAIRYNILQDSVEANKKIYQMLFKNSKQAEMDHGIMGHQIVITSPATLPLAPIKPRKGRIILFGAVMGLLGGIVLALCLELVDNTVQSTQDIQDRLKLPILGAVPTLERNRETEEVDPRISGLEFMAHRFPASPFTDAVRIVENAASSFMPHDTGSSMVVTSALPLEGKTLLSVVIGTVVASEKKKVLVIDGDMRNPRIHEVFQSDASDIGLSDLLTGKTLRLKEAIRQSHVQGLYYMPAGFIPENPVALLKNRRIHDILEACKKVFDAVILDAPPILGLVDARILAGYADGIILVTRAGHTTIDVLREAKDAVTQGQGKLLGIVLNMANRRKGYGSSYYSSRYYNRYYHRYYHRDAKSSQGNGDKKDTRS
jgi:succinoglycan biosynthesis transport protein ExoP